MFTISTIITEMRLVVTRGILFKAEAGAEAVKAGNKARQGTRQSTRARGKADGDRGKAEAEAATQRPMQGRRRLRPEKQKCEKTKNRPH